MQLTRILEEFGNISRSALVTAWRVRVVIRYLNESAIGDFPVVRVEGHEHLSIIDWLSAWFSTMHQDLMLTPHVGYALHYPVASTVKHSRVGNEPSKVASEHSVQFLMLFMTHVDGCVERSPDLKK
jgi:hypothetical protein